MILPHELVLAKESTKTKSTKAKEKEFHPKKRPRKSKAKAKEIPRGILRETVERSKRSTLKMERVQTIGITQKDRGEEHKQRWNEMHWKKWLERKNNGDKNGGKAKKVQK